MLRYLFLSVFALIFLTACGGNDLYKLIETKECVECELSGANLAEAKLSGANLTGAILSDAWLVDADLSGANLSAANLTRANLTDVTLAGANLDGVIGADFTGALNVPKKYLKD